MELTRAEIFHLKATLSDYRDVLESYPEVVTDRQEEQLLVAEEILGGRIKDNEPSPTTTERISNVASSSCF